MATEPSTTPPSPLSPTPQSSSPETAPPPRPSAEETFKNYAVRSGIVAAFFIWFTYDGWFNPEIQAKTFNKVGAVLLGIGLLFCLTMMTSAGLVVLCQRRQSPPPSS